MKAVSMAEEGRQRERERKLGEKKEQAQWGCSVNIERERKNDTR